MNRRIEAGSTRELLDWLVDQVDLLWVHRDAPGPQIDAGYRWLNIELDRALTARGV